MLLSVEQTRNEFCNTGQWAEPDAADIARTISDFLEHYGVASLLGKRFCRIIGKGSGRNRFGKLLEATGFRGDAHGFCRNLIDALKNTSHLMPDPIPVVGHIDV